MCKYFVASLKSYEHNIDKNVNVCVCEIEFRRFYVNINDLKVPRNLSPTREYYLKYF